MKVNKEQKHADKRADRREQEEKGEKAGSEKTKQPEEKTVGKE